MPAEFFVYYLYLGSSSIELDENANLISYEEYHPFGTTSYRSGRSAAEVSLKRYRYVAKEKDEETGLYYYGMWYYDASIAKFISVDPLSSDYLYYTPYQYAGNKPISYIDLDGLEPHRNPNVSGRAEGIGMDIVETIAAGALIKHCKQNKDTFTTKPLRLEGYYTSSDISGLNQIKLEGINYVTDTELAPAYRFNMYVSSIYEFHVDESNSSDYNNYEAFVVAALMDNFVRGTGPENYIFPENGIISNQFLDTDILNEALNAYKKTGNGKAVQYSFGFSEFVSDAWDNETLFNITGLTGSATITIIPTDGGINVEIFNITSLTSGTFGKELFGKSNYPVSYVREQDIPFSVGILKSIKPFGNISQTFNLFIPNEDL